MNHRTRIALALAAVTLVLAGCASEGSGPTPTATTTLSPAPETPTPDPSESSTSTIPASCDDVGSAATRAATIDPLTLQGDGQGFVRPAPPGATLVLGCDWFGGDTTGYLVLISEADAAASNAYVDSLAGDGWACGPGAGGGHLCSITTPNSQYPVDTIESVYTRDGVWIYQSATNLDGAALLADLQASIWES